METKTTIYYQYIHPSCIYGLLLLYGLGVADTHFLSLSLSLSFSLSLSLYLSLSLSLSLCVCPCVCIPLKEDTYIGILSTRSKDLVHPDADATSQHHGCVYSTSN